MSGATFTIHRIEDPSGISGTGVVAEGWESSSGDWCVLLWLSETPSLCVYRDIRDIELIHGHGGKSQIVWDSPAHIPNPESPDSWARDEPTGSLWEAHDDPEVN